MLYNIDLNESNYVQPVRGFVERKMQNNNTELVDFVPESHIRIWYNVQLEGYPSHHHSAAEVIICMQSNYIVIVNSVHYTLHPGDILIIPPHAIHKLICPTPGIRFVFLMNLDPYTSFQDYKAMQPMFLNAQLISPETTRHYESLYNNFAKMIEIYFKNDIFWETDVFALFSKICPFVPKTILGLKMHPSLLLCKKSIMTNFPTFLYILTSTMQMTLIWKILQPSLDSQNSIFQDYLSNTLTPPFMITCAKKELHVPRKC